MYKEELRIEPLCLPEEKKSINRYQSEIKQIYK